MSNTYAEAVARYHEAMSFAEIVRQPNAGLSYRNDKDTGWTLNNRNGYLAFVPDHGGVLR